MLILKIKEIKPSDSQKQSMIGWSMNGISRYQKDKEFRKKNMIDKLNKSVKCKNSNLKNWQNYKSSINKKDKLLKKTMQIRYG